MSEETETRDLKKKLEILERAIKDGLERRGRLPDRKNEREGKIKALDLKLGELHRKRGIIVVSSGSAEEVDAEIKSVTHDKELAGDEIIGLAEALGDLDRELEGLKEEKAATVREIYALHARPLIRTCNELGEGLAVEYRKLWEILRAMGVPQDIDRPAANNVAVCSSFWGGSLILIPRLYVPGEYNQPHANIFKYDPKDYDAAKAKDRLLK